MKKMKQLVAQVMTHSLAFLPQRMITQLQPMIQHLHTIQDQAMTLAQAVIQEARLQVATNKEKKMLTELDLDKDLIDNLTKETVLQTKVKTMFRMQHELNSLIDQDWSSKPHWDFQRATMIELGELMDHYGYKWWKAQTPNVDQCKLEVVDIAHFHISHLIQTALRYEANYDHYAMELAENLVNIELDKTPEGVRKVIDEAIFLASSKNFNSKTLAGLMSAFDIEPEELCNKYIVKNTLNIFRANNGYKAGTYKKIWDGKEDNEVLMEIFNCLDPDSSNLAEELYQGLNSIYNMIAEEKVA
jgi:hypothetical protein